MASACEDTSNAAYSTFWFDYYKSIGYIDSSDFVNLYAPYGKCKFSLLWITYLINLIHFFVLSAGSLYIITFYRSYSGILWSFVTWVLSLLLLIAALVFYIIINLNQTVFSLLTIGLQLAALFILTISIFTVILLIFSKEFRYQKCLFFFIIILLLIQLGCFTGQILITLHCVSNLQFSSLILDYSYLSAIIAAIGTVISTLLLDHMFMWCLKQSISSSRVSPGSITPSETDSQDRGTSPVDSIILQYFHRQPQAPMYYIYSNRDRTRHFHILPNSQQSTQNNSDVIRLQNIGNKRKIHNTLTTSDA